MENLEQIIQIGKNAGFTEVSSLAITTIELLEDVRAMCSADLCGMYGKNASCPPACGSLDELREQIRSYSAGVLVQTVGQIEDSMDYEGMMETEARHKANFMQMTRLMREYYPRLLPLGAGCCQICDKCAYPEAPCRFPELRISSMEAYGILVSDLCKKNGLNYYYGPSKIAYTSCFLLE